MSTYVFTLTPDEIMLAVATYAAEREGAEFGDYTISTRLRFRHGRVSSAVVEFDECPTSPPTLRLVRGGDR